MKLKRNRKRYLGLLGLVLAVFILLGSSYQLSIFPFNYLSAIYASVLTELTNKDRVAQNLDDLTVSQTLTEAAELKAKDMAEKGYFAHISPDGRDPWYWFDEAGYEYAYAGENLAVNFGESEEVDTAWMNSPTHRANIVNNKFTEIGIGIAEGVYQGRQTTFVVQMFGTPLSKVMAKNQVVKKDIPTNSSGGTTLTQTSDSTVLGENTANFIETYNPALPKVELPNLSFWKKVWNWLF